MPSARLLAAAVLLVPGFATRAAGADPAAPALPPVADVVTRLNDLYRAEASEARMTMQVVTAHYRRDLTLEAWTRGRQEALIVVRSPAREAGQATLRSAEGLWTYAPRADRLVRLPSSLLADDWMGSHFTNDDLIRETSFMKDYDTTLAWHEEDGQRLLQATLKPKPGAPVVWSRVVYLLDPRDDLPLRADYFDGGRIVRTLTFGDPHEVGGRRVPFDLRMVPRDKPGEFTRLEYQALAFGVTVDPSLFTPRGLRREAKR